MVLNSAIVEKPLDHATNHQQKAAEEDSDPGTPGKDIWRNVSSGCK